MAVSAAGLALAAAGGPFPFDDVDDVDGKTYSIIGYSAVSGLPDRELKVNTEGADTYYIVSDTGVTKDGAAVTSYTPSFGDNVWFDTAAAPVAMPLPALNNGEWFEWSRRGANPLELTAPTGMTIEGESSIIINRDYTGARLVIIGTDYKISDVYPYYEPVIPNAPTIDIETHVSELPVITGTLTNTFGDTLTVELNGVTYTEGDGNLVVNTNGTWELTVPVGNELANGTYDIVATVSNPAGSTSDASTDEVVINVPDLSIRTLSIASSTQVRLGILTNDGAPVGITWPDGSTATLPSSNSTTTFNFGTAISGDITFDFGNSDPTRFNSSLGDFDFALADIVAFDPNSTLTHLVFTQATSVTGMLSDMGMRPSTVLNIRADSVTGDYSGLAPTLTTLNLTTSTEGDPADIPAGCTLCIQKGPGGFRGDISGFPSVATRIEATGTRTEITGSGADFPTGLTFIALQGTSTLNTTTAQIPSNVTTGRFDGQTVVSGLVSDLPSNTNTSWIFQGVEGPSGDLALMPGTFYDFRVDTTNASALTCSAIPPAIQTTGYRAFVGTTTAFTSVEVDRIMEGLASVTSWSGIRTVGLVGANGAAGTATTQAGGWRDQCLANGATSVNVN